MDFKLIAGSKQLLRIIIIFLFLPSLQCLAQEKPVIGLIGDFSPGSYANEMDSARSFLINRFGAENVKLLDIQKIRKKSSDFPRFQLLWFHRPDSASLKDMEKDPRFTSAMAEYVRNGGNLLLTLDALRILPLLELEKAEPEVRYSNAFDKGYGRKAGLHAFRYHPVFDSLNGGASLYAPPGDRTLRQMGWFGESIPAGKTVAVDWAYIHLRENSKLMAEYAPGKGKVLAIGAYTWLGPENLNQLQLRIFMDNCFNYLLEPVKLPGQYWSYDPRSVSRSVPEPDTVLLYPSEPWLSTGILLNSRKYPQNQPFDNAAERMLVMGRENGGIDELWSHPFMALRDYQAGVWFENSDNIVWLESLVPEIEVTPVSFKRTYRFRRAYLEEVICSHPTEALTAIHYEFRGITGAKLVIRLKSNLRFMWPYSENTTGTIAYEWHQGIQAFRIEDLKNGFSIVAGINKKPVYQAIGQYEQTGITPGLLHSGSTQSPDSVFVTSTTQQHQVSAILLLDLQANDRFDVVFAASANNKKEATDLYRKAIPRPYWVYLTALRNHEKSTQSYLSIQSPDRSFDEGYQWALSGTGKFMINTPGIGRSLAAGYSTTSYGWDGGHRINGRPGYAWYFGRDGAWSGYALLQAGAFEDVRSMLELFIRYQDPSGKIFHELTTSGVVHYDAADATPLFLSLAGRYLNYSGDVNFILRNWNAIEKSLQYCFSTDTDQDGLIENTSVGHGWEEGGMLFGTHTTLYLASCWAEALKQSAYMANIAGKRIMALKLSKEEGKVLNTINTSFWNPESSFFYHGKYQDGTFHPEPAVMAAVPLLFRQVNDTSQWKPVLTTLSTNEFSTDWGVRIIGENSPAFRPDSYHQGSVWPLFTGWTSLAGYQYGRSAQAFSHLMSNLLTYRSWALGYVPEVLHGSEYKPYGVCSHQCWSETMVLQPAIEGMLGLERDAIENRISLSPRVPAHWDSLKIQNIRVGTSYIHAFLKETPALTTWIFEPAGKNEKPVQVSIQPGFASGTRVHRILVDGKEIESGQNGMAGNIQLSVEARRVIEMYKSPGIAVLPAITEPKEGSISRGIRIIEEVLRGKTYQVTVRGRSGSTGSIRIYCPGGINTPTDCRLFQDDTGIFTIEFQLPPADSKYTSMQIQIPLK